MYPIFNGKPLPQGVGLTGFVVSNPQTQIRTVNPLGMRGMAAARERVLQAIERGEAVAVYGDYDVDGITATCLVTDYLRGRGLRVFPYIPDRNEEGYGLNRAALESLHNEGVSLLITVDCGITAAEESEFGRELGMDVEVDENVWQRVWDPEEKVNFASTPQFRIVARKR